MSLTLSNMMPLGTKAPDFALPDTVSDSVKTLEELHSTEGTAIMFICNHCPFVMHIQKELVNLGNEYSARGIAFVAINSNDATMYPDDAPDRMKEVAQTVGYPFPYLYDESQDVARSYQAACTPDIYLFDGNRQCVYRGQLDDSRPGNDIPVTGKDLRAALECLLAGRPISNHQKQSSGCNIKWKRGSE